MQTCLPIFWRLTDVKSSRGRLRNHYTQAGDGITRGKPPLEGALVVQNLLRKQVQITLMSGLILPISVINYYIRVINYIMVIMVSALNISSLWYKL